MNIRDSREEKGISQGELAKKVGISQSTLSKIESGQRAITVGQERLISAALGDEEITVAPEPSSLLPEQVETKPRHIRRAYICAKDDCLYRRFLGPDEPVPSCPQHSRMVEQSNRPYMGQ